MGTSSNKNISYGLNQPLVNVFPSPIVALRNPTTNDKAPLGSLWINPTFNSAFVLTSIINNSSNWESFGGEFPYIEIDIDTQSIPSTGYFVDITNNDVILNLPILIQINQIIKVSIIGGTSSGNSLTISQNAGQNIILVSDSSATESTVGIGGNINSSDGFIELICNIANTQLVCNAVGGWSVS
jgi:hypothetical protein